MDTRQWRKRCRQSIVTSMLLGAVMPAACTSTPAATPPAASSAPTRLAALPDAPMLLFVSLASDDTFHRVEVASLARPAAGAFVTDLTCERVYVGGGRGLCVSSESTSTTTTWWAEIFDANFRPTGRIPVTGAPSRVRVSPDGLHAAATVFESGHSYAEHTFSTATTLFDLERGVSLGNLEEFDTFKDGRRFSAKDFNFWGVSFARDHDTFYATLDTNGVSYLVRGTMSSRRTSVVHPGVECPSISPDNTRIAFKKRVGPRSAGWWQLAVLRLDTLEEQVLRQETRSVDDQVEWLDDERLAYHLVNGSTAADLWSVRADDTTPPERLLTAAYSPAVIRAR